MLPPVVSPVEPLAAIYPVRLTRPMISTHASPDGFSLHHLHQPPGSRRPSGEKSMADARAAAAVLMLVVIALDSPFAQAASNGRQQPKDKTILPDRSALNGQQGINMCYF